MIGFGRIGFQTLGSSWKWSSNIIITTIRKKHRYFCDRRRIRAVGGKGGDGCVSFLQLWCNERAGPDGGDGGNGGHIIFQANTHVNNYNHIISNIRAMDGENGSSNDCHGKSAQHTIIKVPVGTIIRDKYGRIVGDLDKPDLMFIGARGGVGGKGNRFFTTSTSNSPKICEYGPQGEDHSYTLELLSMSEIGLIGLPNVGKSTLLNIISRAKSKVAPYAFTTLKPHLGVVQYKDDVQFAVADLPGLVPGSSKNCGIGIEFLKHAERCPILLILLDVSYEAPWEQYEQLMTEIKRFNPRMVNRPKVVIANKIDLIDNIDEVILELQERLHENVIPISAKDGINISKLLLIIRELYDEHCKTKL